MKILLKNTNYGFIGIDGKRIDYIGKTAPTAAYDTVKDMTGKLIFPGLYNAHCHSAMTLLRGAGSDLPLHDWLFNVVFPLEDRVTPHLAKAGNELALLEMISSGTTSFNDMYFLYDESMEVIVNSGIRAVIGRSLQCMDDNADYESDRRLHEARELYRNWNHAGDGRITIGMAVHAEYTMAEHMVKGAAEEALEWGVPFLAHMSETQKEVADCIERHGVTPIKWFEQLGAFKNPTFAAHCVWVNDDDVRILRENNVTVVHCPSSNMKLGSGFAPIPRYLKEGVNVALGTDGAASNNNLDLIEEMHLASIIHNGYTNDSTVMNSEEVIKIATGRSTLPVGKLTVGDTADIFAIDTAKPHLTPNVDDTALLCYAANGSDVCMTMVDGNILYENGEFFTLDKERILFDANQAVKQIYGN